MSTKTSTTKKTVKLSFNPKKVTKNIVKDLPTRMGTVINDRFGLDSSVRKTLESIGQRYNITRERVRQIESQALSIIKNSAGYSEMRAIFDEIKQTIDLNGGIVHEEDFFDIVFPNDPIMQNHLYFYMTLGDDFNRHRDNTDHHVVWTTNSKVFEHVKKILKDVASELDKNSLFEEAQLVDYIANHSLSKDLVAPELRSNDHVRNWMKVSKLFGSNKLGQFGLRSSYNISTRGIRDYAYLVLHQNGSPLHFREIAQAISNTFGRPVHVATCHNTLISDNRFVLIGRGLYALTEWGYQAGTAQDVIIRVLREAGRPMSRAEIITQVNKERHLKENTILVNLHNTKVFSRDELGNYNLIQ